MRARRGGLSNAKWGVVVGVWKVFCGKIQAIIVTYTTQVQMTQVTNTQVYHSVGYISAYTGSRLLCTGALINIHKLYLRLQITQVVVARQYHTGFFSAQVV